MVCRGSLRRYGGMTLSRVCGDPRRQLAGARADPPEEGGLRANAARVTPSPPALLPHGAKVEKGARGTRVLQGARAVRADPPRQLARARADP